MPPGIFTAADLLDGDALADTPDDNPNITTEDQNHQAVTRFAERPVFPLAPHGLSVYGIALCLPRPQIHKALAT